MCRNFCFVVITFILMIVGSHHVDAKEIPPLDGLEALRRGFSGITDFTAEISQEKRVSLMKKTLIMGGTVRFRKPDAFYMEINPPFASKTLLRDSTIEQTSGRNGEKNRIVLPPDQGLKRWFSKLTTPVSTAPEGVSILADATNGIYTLTIIPQGKGQIKEMTLIFLEDGTIRRLTISELNGDKSTMTFKKVRRNTGLSDKDFRLD